MSEALKDFDLLFSLMPIQSDPNAAQRVLDARDRVRAALEQPSTAEAQARALERAAATIRRCTTDTPEYNPHFIAGFLDGRAKRIREEAE